MRGRVALAFFGALTVLVASGCGDEAGSGTGGDRSGLRDRTFLSESVTEGGADRPLVTGTVIRLSFEGDNRIGATAGCNSMGGRVRVEDRRLVIGPLDTTEMGCDPERHAQDEWLAGVLQRDPRWRLDGDRLRLTAGGTVITLVDRRTVDPDRPLEGTTWVLDGISDGETASSVPEGVRATIFFSGGRVNVEACNQGAAEIDIDGDEIEIETLQMTKRACPPPEGDVDAAIGAVLDGRVTYEIEATSLTLRHASGRSLTFRAA